MQKALTAKRAKKIAEQRKPQEEKAQWPEPTDLASMIQHPDRSTTYFAFAPKLCCLEASVRPICLRKMGAFRSQLGRRPLERKIDSGLSKAQSTSCLLQLFAIMGHGRRSRSHDRRPPNAAATRLGFTGQQVLSVAMMIISTTAYVSLRPEIPRLHGSHKRSTGPASSRLLQSLLLFALARGVTAALHTATEDHDTKSMSLLAVVATVSSFAFILGAILGMWHSDSEQTMPTDVGEQIRERIVPDQIWVSRALGHSFHRDDCPCMWKGGVFTGSKMIRCRRCLPSDCARAISSIAKRDHDPLPYVELPFVE